MDLEDLMKNKGIYTNLKQSTLTSLVIDLQHVLVVEKNVNNILELKQYELQSKDYIIVNLSEYRSQTFIKCCDFNRTPNCICDIKVFQIRPHALKFLKNMS